MTHPPPVAWNGYLAAALALLAFDFLLHLAVRWLNLRHVRSGVPEEFRDVMDAEKYARAQRYLRDSTRFEMVSSAILTPVTILFILLGGFGWADALARSAGWAMIPTGLLFAAVLAVASEALHLPFEIHDTFVLEARYGFNRTTWRTFVADRLKGLLLAAVVGLPLLALALWFFSVAGRRAWLAVWAVLTLAQVVLAFVAPAWILPLFNRFTPLEEGALRSAIEHLATRQDFRLGGIFRIDGSRRSSKANAYFTGFGRWRRIALYDTLIDKHGVDELVAVLAHEIGHARLGHIRRGLALAALGTGLMLFVLSIFLRESGLYAAFGVPFEPVGGQPPLYAGLVLFGFLYSPLSLLIGLIVNAVSRRHEYAADAFAARVTGDARPLVEALRRISTDQLDDLEPHPLKVWVEYSHPPVLARIRRLQSNPQAS